MFLRLSFEARLKSASGESASNESRKQIATDVEVQQTRVLCGGLGDYDKKDTSLQKLQYCS